MEKYLLHIEAERFIHNDLSNCAYGFREQVKKQFDEKDTEGVYFPMMGALVFSAFALEAKVNFIGWKVLHGGWPERANLREKIDLLRVILPLDLRWGERPLQTFAKLKKFRDTLAHGKPEIVDQTKTVQEEPEIWDALKSQWEASVTPDFIDLVHDDIKNFFHLALDAADIDFGATITHGGHSLKKLVDPEQ